MRNFVLTLGAIFLGALCAGLILLLGAGNSGIRADVGKWLLGASASLFLVLVSLWLKSRESAQSEWQELGSKIVDIDQRLDQALARLHAHQTVESYREQMEVVGELIAELRNATESRRVRADRELFANLKSMRRFLKDLRREYGGHYRRLRDAANQEEKDQWKLLDDPENLPALHQFMKLGQLREGIYQSSYAAAKRRIRERTRVEASESSTA